MKKRQPSSSPCWPFSPAGRASFWPNRPKTPSSRSSRTRSGTPISSSTRRPGPSRATRRKYNDKLEDPSEGALDKFNEAVTGFNTELVSKLDMGKLSADNQIEREMLLGFYRPRIPQAPIHPAPGTTTPCSTSTCSSRACGAFSSRTAAPAWPPPRPGPSSSGSDQEGQGQPEEPAAGIHPSRHRSDAGHDRFLPGRDAQALRGRLGSPGRDRQGRPGPRGPPEVPEGRVAGQIDGQLPDARLAQADPQKTTQGNLPIVEELLPQSQTAWPASAMRCSSSASPSASSVPRRRHQAARTDQGQEQTRNIVIQGVLDKIKGDHVGRTSSSIASRPASPTSGPSSSSRASSTCPPTLWPSSPCPRTSPTAPGRS